MKSVFLVLHHPTPSHVGILCTGVYDTYEDALAKIEKLNNGELYSVTRRYVSSKAS